MPRDGSGNYTLPYPAVVDGTTIESAVHNGTMSDIALQLNGPVPIIAGGTGANNAHDAMIALSGEIAKQGPVGNFDTFPFVNGSWYCNGSSTAAPNSNAFYGTYYEHANPQYAAVYAQEVTGSALNKVYVRFKNGGVWDAAWQAMPGSVADLDARYVNLTGDTMTGALNIGGAATIKDIAQATPATYPGDLRIAGAVTTTMAAVGGIELTVADGYGWKIHQLSAAGAALSFGSRFGVSAWTERVRFSAQGDVNILNATASTSPTTGALVVAGGVGVGGAIHAEGNNIYGRDLYAARTSTTGYLFLGSDTTKYLGYDGSTYDLAVAPLKVGGGIVGVVDASAAPAGTVGEHVIASATGVSITTGASKNITSIALTPGDWDVAATATVNGNGTTTFQQCAVSINTTSATMGTAEAYAATTYGAFTVMWSTALAVPMVRINVTAATTVYLVTNTTFGASTATATGSIMARRRR